MKNLIVNELQKVNTSDFYILERIPKDKLRNAINNYPIPAKEDVLALIDATVFGSAKNGMAIGLQGVYWKNDWTTDTVKNFLHWNDLAANIKKITTQGSNLILSPGCVFSLAGSSVKPNLLLDLLINIISKISQTNESELENSSLKTSQELSTQPDNRAGSNKIYPKESQPLPEPEKTIEKPVTDNRFSGKYDRELLKIVNEISKKYRLSRQISIAPAIQVNKAKTILDICNNSIDPFSILVIVDNTFFQTGKDFLIVTDKYIMSKSMMKNLDKFDLSEIRNISCNNDEFFINNYEFQFFDQLEHSEIRVLVDFLNELIPEIKNNSLKLKSSNKYHVNAALSHTLEKSFATVARELNREFNSENDSDNSEFLDQFLKTLYAVFIVIENNSHSSSSSDKYYLLHHYLLAFICILAFAGSKIEAINEDENLASCYLFSIFSIIKNISEIGKNNGLHLEWDTNKYLTTFNNIFKSSYNGIDFYQTLNGLLESFPEDEVAIIIFKESIDDAITHLRNSFS